MGDLATVGVRVHVRHTARFFRHRELSLGRLTCTGLVGTTILWTREVLMERRVTISTMAGLLFLGGSTLAAHDLWIVPENFRPGAGASVGIELRVGEKFPKSMNAPSLEGLLRLAAVSTDGEKAIEGARKAGKVVAASFVAPPGGTFAVVLEGKPRQIVLPGAQFRDYLLHEGLAHIHQERVRLGEDKKEGRESYSRHAKALLRSGPEEGTATRATGLKLELVPGADPYDLRAGQALPVTALYEGKPLGGLELRFYRAGSQVQRARTSPEGTANLTFDKPGLWCVAFIHMERCSGCPDADWRSYFGTLTFELPGPSR